MIRVIVLWLVRFFYRRIEVKNVERLPRDVPVIVVANHPNGLIDPIIVNMALKRPVAFLGKSTLFRSWLGARAMAAFHCIPVYRAKEADTSQNEKTFALAREHLAKNGWLALFPEGISHSEPTLQPLKTGAARIALSTGLKDLRIVPIGLVYDDKDVFRSGVTATVGAPMPLDLQRDPRGLTDDVAVALREVMLEADDTTLWHGFRFAARWLGASDVEAKARELAAAYRTLAEEDAAAITDEVRTFKTLTDAAGVREPFDLAEPQLRSFFVTALGVTLALPFAGVGALLAWLPYRLTGVVARKLARGEQDLVSTFKALGGLLFIGSAYVIEAIVAGLWRWWAAPALLVIGPLTGYIALRFGEWLDKRRRLVGAVFIDRAKIASAQKVLARRIADLLTREPASNMTKR